jgi:hypothetical protein
LRCFTLWYNRLYTVLKSLKFPYGKERLTEDLDALTM